jgi:PTH1 family peptidyl-tRNA hydrolase
MPVPAWLIAGLGNPGPAHAGNRHNIGFMALDAIAAHHGFAPARRRFAGETRDGSIAGLDVLALKPMTFMNESGRAVAEAVRFFKLPPARVVVLHDELDLAAGKVRVKLGGGAAGHNGVRSIDDRIGAGFWRIRLGIGHPGDRERVLGHVLKDFARTDADWLEPLLDRVATHIGLVLTGDAAAFMSKVAPPPPARPRKPPVPGGAPMGGGRGPEGE